MDTARTQALEYARAGGYSDIRLLEVSETIVPSRPMPMFGRVLAEQAAAAPTPVQPGMVQASVVVTVSYEMTR